MVYIYIYIIREGDLRIIRPFVFTRENELRCFAEKSYLPVISENCPACFEAPKVWQAMGGGGAGNRTQVSPAMCITSALTIKPPLLYLLGLLILGLQGEGVGEIHTLVFHY